MTGIPGYQGWILQLDPPAVAINRTMLDLNDGVLSVGATGGGANLDFGTSQITEYLAQQGQYGSTVADYVIPNRTITIPLGIGMDQTGADPEEALRNLATKVGLIFREGGWLLRQRYDSATDTYGPAMYADIVSATLDVPDAWLETGGIEPGVTLTLECLPDFYGDPVTLDLITCTGGQLIEVLTESGEPAVIAGDWPARCQIEVTNPYQLVDDSYNGYTVTNLWWAFQSRHYSASQALWIPATDFTVAPGVTSTEVTEAGSISTEVREFALSDESGLTGGPLGLATFSQDLIGTYNVLLRCQASSVSGFVLENSWRPAGGASSYEGNTNSYAVPAAGKWQLLNLGPITLGAVPNPLGSYPTPYVTLSLDFTLTGTGVDSDLYFDGMLLLPADESSGSVGGLTDMPAISSPATGAGSTRYLVIRSDGVFAQDQTVNNFGPVGSQGDLPRLPPSGLEDRPVLMVVRPMVAVDPDGNAFAVTGDEVLLDFTAQVTYWPCYMVRP